MIVEINGIKYQSVDEPKKGRTISKWEMAAIMMGGMSFGITGSGIATKRGPDVSRFDFVKEYELIKNKKSTLSRGQREYIVRYFERHFKPLENEE